jgi:formamidopyrimidine-DNA glycosylase
MDDALVNRTIINAQVNQPKVLNQTVEAFRTAVINSTFLGFRQRGKWIIAMLTNDWLMAFNLGMGGEIRLHPSHDEPNQRRERVVFTLDTNEQLWIHFWWFGHVHVMLSSKLWEHPQLGNLGIEPSLVSFHLKH